MMCAKVVIAVLLLGGSFAAQAQDTATKSADYGSAFEQLIKLGLPDAKGASYVKLTLSAGGRSGESDYYGRDNRVSREGNAWVLPGEKEGVSTILHKYYKQIKVSKKPKRNGLMRALIGKAKPTKGAGALGDWSTVDVAKDTDKIIASLETMAKGDRVFDSDRWGYDGSASQLASNVLVIACHMYRAGHTKDGNRLAQKILTLSPVPTMVIDGIISDLAEQQYKVLVEDFFITKDWKAYHEGLVALTERFPRGWKGRLGAQVLLPMIERRTKGEKATVTHFKNVNLKPEAVKILDELLTRTEPIGVNPTPFWLIVKPGKKSDSSYSGDEPAEEWLKKLCAMGMDGFVALAAVAADETLIATSIKGSDSSAYSRMYMLRSMMGSSNSIDVQALAAYSSMQRPCTRGEIARKILISTMPDAENELESKSPEELRDTAYQWWLEHLNDSKSKLARHIMETGEDDEQAIAVQVLISSGKDSDAKLVEEFIMSAESLSVSLTMLEPYLKARRGKAKAFFDTYSKAIIDQASGGDQSSLPWSIRESGGIEKFLKRLSVYVEDVSPEKILSDMKTGKVSIKDGLAMMGAAVGEEGMFKQLPALVEIAGNGKNLIEQTEILQQLIVVVYKDYNQIEEGKKEAYLKSLATSLEKSKADWKKLLARTETPTDEKELEVLRTMPSLAVFAAWSMEAIYYPQQAQSLQQINQVLGQQKMSEFILNRANQLVDGSATAEFPNPEKVKEIRRKEIREALTTLTSIEVMAFYNKLTLEEKLAWTEILTGYEKELPAGVEGLRKLIAKVNWEQVGKLDAAYKKKINDLVVNKELNKELIENFLTAMANEVDQHVPFTFIIQGRGQAGQGMTLQVWSGAQAQTWRDGMIGEGGKALLEGKAKSLVGVSTYVEGDWLAGIRFSPAKDAPDHSAQIKKVIETAQSNLSKGSPVNVVFFAETAAHLKKLQKDAIPGLLPSP